MKGLPSNRLSLGDLAHVERVGRLRVPGVARAHVDLLARRPALSGLDGHDAVRLEHVRELVALRLRLNALPNEASPQVLDLLLMPRRKAVALRDVECGLRLVGLALVADERLVARCSQRQPPELVEAALTRTAALAARNL